MATRATDLSQTGNLPYNKDMNAIWSAVKTAILVAFLATAVIMAPVLVSSTPCSASASQATATSQATTALPRTLERALATRNPVRLADTRLPRLSDLSDAQIDALARRLTAWPVPRRVAAFAFLQVGTPYSLGPLGEEQPPDADPLIQYRVSDCAVLNLVSTALAHATEVGGPRNAMKIANYRGGIVSYATRFHFTTDRLDSCPWQHDVTTRVGSRQITQARDVVLNRKPGGGRWINIPWQKTRRVSYIPMAEARHFAAWARTGRLPEVCGVAFVQEAKMAQGLDVVHESLLWQGRTLLHASSRTGRVVTMDWNAFLAERGRLYDGVVLFEYQ